MKNAFRLFLSGTLLSLAFMAAGCGKEAASPVKPAAGIVPVPQASSPSHAAPVALPPPAPQQATAPQPGLPPAASTAAPTVAAKQPAPTQAAAPTVPVSEAAPPAAPEFSRPSAAAIEKKLDSQLNLALKQLRGELPASGPGYVYPNIPIKDPDGSRVLVDVSATVSDELFNHLKSIGATVDTASVVRKTVRAMVPVTQLETVAARPDVTAVTPATITDTSVIKTGRPN